VFTGIIEHLGTIESLDLSADGGKISIHAPSVAGSLAVSSSIAVNGCCLTVVSLTNERLSADLSRETLDKTSFRELKPGARVNLERPLTAGKEFGGHFVLGHVDATGQVTRLKRESPGSDSWWLGVQIPAEFARYMVLKGSITIDGISLTVASWHNGVAGVAVIPYTYQHTNLCDLKRGDAVNLEGDVLGKYVERYLEARNASAASPSRFTEAQLIEEGF
jgi:riboflavin synthase